MYIRQLQKRKDLQLHEYKDDLEQFAKDSGYSKVDTFTDKYDKETIVKSMLVKKAQNLVMDSAVITEK